MHKAVGTAAQGHADGMQISRLLRSSAGDKLLRAHPRGASGTWKRRRGIIHQAALDKGREATCAADCSGTTSERTWVSSRRTLLRTGSSAVDTLSCACTTYQGRTSPHSQQQGSTASINSGTGTVCRPRDTYPDRWPDVPFIIVTGRCAQSYNSVCRGSARVCSSKGQGILAMQSQEGGPKCTVLPGPGNLLTIQPFFALFCVIIYSSSTCRRPQSPVARVPQQHDSLQGSRVWRHCWQGGSWALTENAGSRR